MTESEHLRRSFFSDLRKSHSLDRLLQPAQEIIVRLILEKSFRSVNISLIVQHIPGLGCIIRGGKVCVQCLLGDRAELNHGRALTSADIEDRPGQTWSLGAGQGRGHAIAAKSEIAGLYCGYTEARS